MWWTKHGYSALLSNIPVIIAFGVWIVVGTVTTGSPLAWTLSGLLPLLVGAMSLYQGQVCVGRPVLRAASRGPQLSDLIKTPQRVRALGYFEIMAACRFPLSLRKAKNRRQGLDRRRLVQRA
jgi:hypothetical protein